MVALKLRNFGGMLPAVDDTLLPDTAAALSENAWVYPGTLGGLKQTRFLRDLDPSTRRVYRFPKNEGQPYNYTFSHYMEFSDPDTDVVRSPIFGDTHKRLYWASPSSRPMYNTTERILDGDDPYYLGIPAPAQMPDISVSGGSNPDDTTRVYVYTWVSEYGEESAPSPARIFSDKGDGTWNLTLFAPGGATANRNLTHTRIYRTVTTLSGTSVFFLVDEIPIATLSYADTKSNAVVAANAIMECAYYYEPPADLKGMVMMTDGIIAAWRENEIWFCEPFRPHAWPVQYVLTVEYPIVNCGVIGNSLVVLTRGNPAVVSGSHPSNMSQSKIQVFEPCLSKNSVVAMEEGLAYVSHSGLVLVSPGGIANVTQQMIDRYKWMNDYGAKYIKGARINSVYLGFGSMESGAFEPTAFENTAFEMYDYSGARTGFYLDPRNERVGFNALRDDPVLMVFEDAWTGDVLMVKQDATLNILSPIQSDRQRVYKWRSKIFHMDEPINLGAVKIMFVPPSLDEMQLNDEVIELYQNLKPDQYALFKVYADDVHVYTKELRESGEIFRLPSGFKAQNWQFEIEGRVTVRSIEIASTVRELQSV